MSFNQTLLIDLPDKNEVINYLKTEEACCLYDLGLFDDALHIIENNKLEQDLNWFVFILKFGSLISSKNIDNKFALKYFKSNRKKFNGYEKEQMLKFIKKRYEYDEFDINYKYCYYILNKNYKDRILADKLKNELLDQIRYFYDVL